MWPFVRHFVKRERERGRRRREKRRRRRRGEERPYLGILRRRRPEAVHVARPQPPTDRPTHRYRDVTADKITLAPSLHRTAARRRMTLQLCCDRPSRCAGGRRRYEPEVARKTSARIRTITDTHARALRRDWKTNRRFCRISHCERVRGDQQRRD